MTDVRRDRWAEWRMPVNELTRLSFGVVSVGAASFVSSDGAIAWSCENGLVGTMNDAETGGKGLVLISKNSIREMLNPTQVGKSASRQVHYAALTKLRELIRASVIVESHFDLRKGHDMKRSAANGVNEEILIDVAYAALRMDAETYRAKITFKRYRDPNTTEKVYAYHVTKIEVLTGNLVHAAKDTDPKANTPITNQEEANLHLTADILLNGVCDVNGVPLLEGENEVSAKLIDGKQLAANLRGEIAAGVAALKAEKGVTPGLAVILVGDNPASVSYVTAKEKACAEAGMYSREIRMPATIAESELLDKIAALNADPAIHGILVQLPLPKGFDEKKVIRAIAPEKDVDGFTPINVGKMLIGEPCFLPCTPHGIIKLIEFSGMDVRGKHAVVIGRSNIVGKPVAVLLSRKETNATVTLCHTGTPDISKFTKEADVVVVAAGRPNTVTGDMLKEGAVVIDVGVNHVPDATKPRGYRLVGDADFESCAQVASAITPVPGGVGPMTITMLLWNTLEGARAVGRAI